MYLQLSMPEVWACQHSLQWVRKLQSENILCGACTRVLPGRFPAPIDVVYNTSSYPIRSHHRHFASQTGVALIDKELLERLRPHLPRVAIGRAVDLSGNEIDTHATIYPERAVDPRGGPPRKIQVCIECGTIRAYPATSQPDRFVAFQVEGARSVIDRVGTIYVSEQVASCIPVDEFEPLFLQPIEVDAKPIDGLRYPGDPAWVLGRDASVSWDPTCG